MHFTRFVWAGLVGGLLTASSSVLAQAPDVKATWDSFQAGEQSQWTAVWSPDGSRAVRMRGKSEVMGATAKDAADNFLSSMSSVLGVSADLGDIEYTGKRESPGASHLSYRQTYKGLPVFNGAVEVHVNEAGQVFLLHNQFRRRGHQAGHQRPSRPVQAPDIAGRLRSDREGPTVVPAVRILVPAAGVDAGWGRRPDSDCRHHEGKDVAVPAARRHRQGTTLRFRGLCRCLVAYLIARLGLSGDSSHGIDRKAKGAL